MHLGSLFTALASYLDARANNGKWLLRIDDLDTPRNRPGAVDAILKCLETFGLCWDDSVYYQSQHLEEYRYYLAKLAENGLTYRCVCSRKILIGSQDNANNPHKIAVYPRTCLNKGIKENTPHAIRINVEENELAFNDGLQGEITRQLILDDGDFILKRRDNIIAYQFAVVIDDHLQQINQVVRGSDLLLETPKQIYLQHQLGLPTPSYKHVPVLVDDKGYKLSKQTLASAVDTQQPNKTLFELLVLLKQNPPVELSGTSVKELFNWAVLNWSPEVLSRCSTLCLQLN